MSLKKILKSLLLLLYLHDRDFLKTSPLADVVYDSLDEPDEDGKKQQTKRRRK